MIITLMAIIIISPLPSALSCSFQHNPRNSDLWISVAKLDYVAATAAVEVTKSLSFICEMENIAYCC